MSDQKLTDLTAAGALSGTELLYMVQSGTDVKVTAQAVADLAAGSVTSVNTQTGDVTLVASDVGAAAISHTHAISDVTGLQTSLDGKQSTLVSATNIKTINGASILGSGDLTVTGAGAEPVHFVMQAADRTLTSTTAVQQIFNQTQNGALTLPTGRYSFQCGVYITNMSSTSGNARFDLVGAGTATVNGIFYATSGIDNNSPLTVGNRGGSISVTSQSVANGLSSASTGTGVASQITGTFNVTSGGTIIPSLLLTTAAAATLKENSYFRCQKIAATGVNATSEWS